MKNSNDTIWITLLQTENKVFELYLQNILLFHSMPVYSYQPNDKARYEQKLL